MRAARVALAAMRVARAAMRARRLGRRDRGRRPTEAIGAGSDPEAVRTLHRALDLGVTLLDIPPADHELIARDLRPTEPTHPDPTTEALRAIAARHDVSPAQGALARVHHQGAVPIPSTKRVKYLHANLAAASLQPTPEQLALIP